MGALLSRLFAWLLGRLFNRPPPPSAEAVQAEKVGATVVSLDVERKANAEIAKAVAAARVSDDRAARDPDSLRAPSPDSRD